MKINLAEEANYMISLIKKELENTFYKSASDAEHQIAKAKVYEAILKEPLGLHVSPHDWAFSVLTENHDLEAIEKYCEAQDKSLPS